MDCIRGFVNDGDNVAATRRKIAQQNVTMLELMLSQVANLCHYFTQPNQKELGKAYMVILGFNLLADILLTYVT